MLEDWTFRFPSNCNLLLDTAIGFYARVSWIYLSDAVPGLLSPAPVYYICVCWILRMEAWRKNFQAKSPAV